MKKHYSDVLGVVIGLIGYRVFFWGIEYDPQLFFNALISILLCYVLYKIDQLHKKDPDKWTSFVISIVAGVLASYIYLSH